MIILNNKFQKSHFCEDDGCGCGCVEVKQSEDTISVRSTYTPDSVVTFTFDEWRTFIKGAKVGEFDIKEKESVE